MDGKIIHKFLFVAPNAHAECVEHFCKIPLRAANIFLFLIKMRHGDAGETGTVNRRHQLIRQKLARFFSRVGARARKV